MSDVQVTPFILRRTKDAVLKDLPPKILQDIYCDLSPLQAALYEGFSTSQEAQVMQGNIAALDRTEGTAESAPHVFQARLPVNLYIRENFNRDI